MELLFQFHVCVDNAKLNMTHEGKKEYEENMRKTEHEGFIKELKHFQDNRTATPSKSRKKINEDNFILLHLCRV